MTPEKAIIKARAYDKEHGQHWKDGEDLHACKCRKYVFFGDKEFVIGSSWRADPDLHIAVNLYHVTIDAKTGAIPITPEDAIMKARAYAEERGWGWAKENPDVYEYRKGIFGHTHYVVTPILRCDTNYRMVTAQHVTFHGENR